MLTNIKLSKTQTIKVIQSGGSSGYWLANLGKKAVINATISSARDSLPRLASNLISNAINKLGREIRGKGAVKAGKGFILFILN